MARGVANLNAEAPAERPCDCNSWKKRLQIVDFALMDLVLYLDAYPNCSEALAYYKALCEEREMLLSAMPSQGACAITHQSNRDGECWTWTEDPWPWQPEANV